LLSCPNSLCNKQAMPNFLNTDISLRALFFSSKIIQNFVRQVITLISKFGRHVRLKRSLVLSAQSRKATEVVLHVFAMLSSRTSGSLFEWEFNGVFGQTAGVCAGVDDGAHQVRHVGAGEPLHTPLQHHTVIHQLTSTHPRT